jgi:hypothetical protein
MSNESAFPPKESVGGLEYAEERGQGTVTMIFPHAVTLNLDNYTGTVQFEKGPQEVPIELSEHRWLKANGVILYAPRKIAPKVPEPTKEPDESLSLEELTAMTKDQLILHAAEQHDIELQKNRTKDELIAEILAAQKKG